MKHIGITGRMGSGKSFISRIFQETFGIPVFDSDKEAKACYREAHIRDEVCRVFGNFLLLPDKQLDLKALGKLVFAQPEKTEALNRIVHPEVMRRYRRWNENQRQDCPYTLFESAILFESHLDTQFDAIIYVHCPEHISVERVRQRNGWSEEDIRLRLQLQQSQATDCDKADFRIEHDSTASLKSGRERLLPQIREIHRRIISMP